MSSISKLLKKSNRIKNEISPNDFEYLIKKNFTQCWNFFLTFQIEYLTNFKKKFFKDYESVSIFFMIVYNQNLNLNKNTKNNPTVSSNLKDSYVDKMISLTRASGLNAMSISDLTGIPRPTVIRKINKLIKSKWVAKDKKGLFSINSNQNFTEINKLRLKNIERISDMVSKFFNAARISKSKKN